MKEIIINKNEEGQRLIRYLEKYMPGASRGFLYKMLRKKNIVLGETRADGKEVLREGDRILIYFSEETLDHFCREDRESRREDLKKSKKSELRKDVRILYANEDILLLHKPAGMLSQKSAPGDDSLNDWLLDYCRQEGIIHERGRGGFRPSLANRLDRNTSGVCLAGLSVAGLQALSALMRDRSLRKYYLCLVKGPMKGEGYLSGYLHKDRQKNQVRLVRNPEKGAVPVKTAYKVLSSCDRASLLSVDLITGKSHQIRAHLAAEGHPLLGDGKYGDARINRQLKKELSISWQLLHSWKVVIPDRIPCPRDSLSGPAMDLIEKIRGLNVTDPPPFLMESAIAYYGLSPQRGE